MGQRADDRHVQAYSLTSMGHALAGLGRPSEAMDAYREAVTLRRQLGEHHLANAPLAGLARVCLAQGDLDQAQAYVEEILSYLKTGTLHGPTEPFRVYLTCYRVLCAQGYPRADAVLQTAYHLLREWAANISDEDERRSFLENVAANREIVTAYAGDASE